MTAAKARTEGFDAATRRRVLDDHAVVQTALEELTHLEVGTDRAFRHRLAVHEALYIDYSIDLRREYAGGVPVVALSRCPYTDQVLHHSIDHHGLDGLWWDYQGPVRPAEDLPTTFLGLTGALRLDGPLEHTQFLVKPGPAVPFVVPRILEAGATAVISQIAIGAHTGYAVTYFGERHPQTTLFNEWGRNDHRLCSDGVPVAWDQDEDPSAMDFDLAPWLASEQLLWIEPGDDDLQLWSGEGDCPYLDLPGTRERQRFQYGRAWT